MKPISVDDLAGRLGRWSAGRGSLYLLLAARLRELIDEGLLPPGTLLPPDRSLASGLAVGRTTVIAAYDLLRQEGRLDRRRGSGTWVSSGGRAAAREETANPMFVNLLEPPDGVLQFACAGPMTPPARLVEAQRRAVDRLAGEDLGYHPSGHPALRAALAARYRDLGVPTTAGQVLVTTGAQQALALLTRALVRPGDEVLVEAPTYPGALDLFREVGAVVRADDDLAGALGRGTPALVYAMPAFRNPTGSSMSPLERARLIRSAGDVPLVFDEVLADLDLSGAPAPPPVPGVITVGSLSKVVWGGLRVGWVRADAALVARLARFKAVHDLGSAVLDQWAAVELLADFAAVRSERVTALRRQHDHLCARLREELPEWEFAHAEGGQTLWVRLPGSDAASYAQVALRHGVAVLPGGSLDPTGGSADRLRLPFTAEPPVISAAVAALAAAWRAFGAESTRRPLVPSMSV
ncbi:GntR family transcriptional regulator [Saccharothrix sp. NRRL B-16348]|uniref:aminotransferase-like domain-containing protein n=1 Tax=Saccharothrix sp. NRRL B-16348 TaxID=1415542 RepID=UPI0006AE96C1|nr:PLP-dependent aminotransferase family protein [Saccharothrix sp. NRRL B-16348]KOX19930.1 GntR family transcriptional regulator [Saccharothrix sp. NRRL B-16348]